MHVQGGIHFFSHSKLHGYSNSIQPEDVDAKAADMISEAVLNQLVHANWKERLAGIEALAEVKLTNYRVCTGPGILLWYFPGLECHGKKATGPGKFWKSVELK